MCGGGGSLLKSQTWIAGRKQDLPAEAYFERIERWNEYCNLLKDTELVKTVTCILGNSANQRSGGALLTVEIGCSGSLEKRKFVTLILVCGS